MPLLPHFRTNSMAALGQQGRFEAQDSYHGLHVKADRFIGIDVGTGSARACIIDSNGDILGLASENIGLWTPQLNFYVRFAYRPLKLS